MRQNSVNSAKSVNSVNLAKKKASSGWFGTLLKLFIVAAIIFVAVWLAAQISEQIAATQAETAEIQALIQAELYIRQEIEDEAAFTQSREFIEDVARNFLGLVHRDEIIFIMVD